jgi:hypothetical protein
MLTPARGSVNITFGPYEVITWRTMAGATVTKSVPG